MRSYDGGWADYVRPRAERGGSGRGGAAAERRSSRSRRREPAEAQQGPSELERIEAEIAAREAEVAELERQLAEDWSDVDTVAAHRRVRDELQALLTEWEELFESSR